MMLKKRKGLEELDITERFCRSAARTEEQWGLEIIALSKYPQELVLADNKKKILDALVKKFRGDWDKLERAVQKSESKRRSWGVKLRVVGCGEIQGLFVTFRTQTLYVNRSETVHEAFCIPFSFRVGQRDCCSTLVLTEQAWRWHCFVNARVPKRKKMEKNLHDEE